MRRWNHVEESSFQPLFVSLVVAAWVVAKVGGDEPRKPISTWCLLPRTCILERMKRPAKIAKMYIGRAGDAGICIDVLRVVSPPEGCGRKKLVSYRSPTCPRVSPFDPAYGCGCIPSKSGAAHDDFPIRSHQDEVLNSKRRDRHLRDDGQDRGDRDEDDFEHREPDHGYWSYIFELLGAVVFYADMIWAVVLNADMVWGVVGPAVWGVWRVVGRR